MITAEEARKRAKTKYEQEVSSEIAEINGKILAAVDKGDTSIFIFHSIHTETADCLRDLWYSVTQQDNFRNEVDITISW